MSHTGKFESLPYEMHRTILEFTDPGFEPLKRVNKMFYEFERMPHRMDTVAEEVEKRWKKSPGRFQKVRRDVLKMVPYMTSVNLLQWALDELEMPKELVCRAIACSGHLDVLQWARAQDPPCDWDEYVCSNAARYGHLDVIEWLRTQNLPAPWLRHFRDH